MAGATLEGWTALPELPPSHELMEEAARSRIAAEDFAYFVAGAGAERSLDETAQAWGSWWLRPRVLRDTTATSTSTTVLGEPLALPVLTAPVALNARAHPEGEVAVARGAAAAGTLQVVSTSSSLSVDEVGRVGHRFWFQLYTTPDWEETLARVARAERAGARALVVTVDLPELGIRPRGLGRGARSTSSSVMPALSARLGRTNNALDWAALERIRAATAMPLVLKGIVHPADARLAADAGVAAIIVSNHGARQLDGELPSALALRACVEAVGSRCEVYVDSGIRGGEDVLRALALGARCVLVGRPFLWALSARGADGVHELLERLREELRSAMVLCGQVDAAAVEPDIVVPRHCLGGSAPTLASS